MVEDLADLSTIEAEMSMTEVNKGDNASEQEHPRIISLALLLERIVSQLITIRLIVNFGILLKGLCESISREDMTVTISKLLAIIWFHYCRRGKSL